MNLQQAIISLIFSVMASVAIGQQHFPMPTRALPSEQNSLCNLMILPLEVQSFLKDKFGLWKIQESTNLSANARKRWEAEKPLECPGIVAGQFKNTNGPAFAGLLVSRDRSVFGYKFLIFSPRIGQTSYEMTVIEQSDANDVAVDLFIHTARISEFFNKKWRYKLKTQTNVGLLFACAGKDEYETDLYYWSEGAYRHEWIDY
jgi:hypothetical protein